ncbi:hypothetical protein [Nostoc sp. 'Peltigera membranacea cyanobiont' 232]|uniref:hypothetical protein n=1 Tax=Nostoc sp. 'Peltigera membranacea cyanobiont' 232 TaxID=2014531 RepID=UPI0016734850|nr:hypothetical protein [Nostoc sp. 'Peltigera membranacea cyanobiont' 232]
MTLYQVTQSTDNGNGDTVGTLSYAILQANRNAGTDAIEFKSNIRITSVMKTLLNSDIVVIGNGKTVSGDANNDGITDNQDLRPFFIKSGNVKFSDLTITNSTAKGGYGGNTGGGGAGMGGGMFIYDGNVSLSNVTFSNNRAEGGVATSGSSNLNTGGGGGMFGGGQAGGGGLFGSSLTENGDPYSVGTDGGYGGNGNYGGYRGNSFDGSNGGFGGGGGNNGGAGGFGGGGGISVRGTGGNGGFGGGGGGGKPNSNGPGDTFSNGGDGGYGGGFGRGGTEGSSGKNGFGAGYGDTNPNDGAGMGGAIFIRSGTLTLNSVKLNNNVAHGGNEFVSDGTLDEAKGFGGALFIMKSTTNTNGNNQGMPTTLPTVVSEGTEPTYSGNSDTDDSNNNDSDNSDYLALSTPWLTPTPVISYSPAPAAAKPLIKVLATTP